MILNSEYKNEYFNTDNGIYFLKSELNPLLFIKDNS